MNVDLLKGPHFGRKRIIWTNHPFLKGYVLSFQDVISTFSKSSHNFSSHLSYFRALVLFVFLWFFVSVCLSCLRFWFVFLFWFPPLLKVGAKLYRFFFFQYDESLIGWPCLVLARPFRISLAAKSSTPTRNPNTDSSLDKERVVPPGM